MNFRVNIECDNAAFCNDDCDGPNDEARGAEVARILRELADKIEDGYTAVYLTDVNGNRTGHAAFKEED